MTGAFTFVCLISLSVMDKGMGLCFKDLSCILKNASLLREVVISLQQVAEVSFTVSCFDLGR